MRKTRSVGATRRPQAYALRHSVMLSLVPKRLDAVPKRPIVYVHSSPPSTRLSLGELVGLFLVVSEQYGYATGCGFHR